MTQENMLARYAILRELGRGAASAVYAARDRHTGRAVALKRVESAPSSKAGGSTVDRLLKHVRSARLLKHRNIVEVYEAGEIGGTVYVAMEMLEGRNLREILGEGPLPVARAIRIAHDIACALAHAHLQGVVHGGIKPSNVIVLPSGVAKVADFGMAQVAPPSGAAAGPASYMSPEQLRGEPVDHRCDIFSLGAVFYEMLAQRPPFAGASPKEVMENMVHAEPPPPSELNPNVPRALDPIVFSMLAQQPASRMPGAPVLVGELQRLEEGLGLEPAASAASEEPTASVPPAAPEPAPRRPDAPGRFRGRAPVHDAPRPEEVQHGDREPRREAIDFDYQNAIALMERESRRERTSRSRPARFAALAFVLGVVGIGLGGLMYYSADPGELRNAVSRIQESLATALATSRPTAPAPVAGETREEVSPGANSMLPKPLAEEPVALAQRHPLAARASEEPAERGIAASRVQQAPMKASAASRPAAPPPVVEEAKKPAAPSAAPQASLPRAAGEGSSEQTESVVAGAAEAFGAAAPPPVAEEARPAATPSGAPPAGAAPAKQPPRAMQPAVKAAEQQSAGTARLILAVSPRGELYIDGKHHGTTPPITTFDLEPGMHRIEVRSGSRTPYLTYMTLQPGDVRRIRHDFDTSRAVHPPRSASWQNSSRAAR